MDKSSDNIPGTDPEPQKGFKRCLNKSSVLKVLFLSHLKRVFAYLIVFIFKAPVGSSTPASASIRKLRFGRIYYYYFCDQYSLVLILSDISDDV